MDAKKNERKSNAQTPAKDIFLNSKHFSQLSNGKKETNFTSKELIKYMIFANI